MRLRLFIPTRTLVDCEAVKIVARAPNGSFGILPRHVDFVSALAAGVLAWTAPDGSEHYAGTDEGVLIKRAHDVRITTRRAFPGDDLEGLRQRLRDEILAPGEPDRAARTALSRLEAGMIRRLAELRHPT